MLFWTPASLKKGAVMGAEPWSYVVPFEPSVEAALEKLRRRVFESGEYRGSEMNPATPMQALEMMEADGTASILDMLSISDSPGICSVCPLGDEQLKSLFGTTQPTREMIESNHDLYQDIDRGQGIYIIAYKDGQPSEYFFAGYSFD
jgi:hypothetical protein